MRKIHLKDRLQASTSLQINLKDSLFFLFKVNVSYFLIESYHLILRGSIRLQVTY